MIDSFASATMKSMRQDRRSSEAVVTGLVGLVVAALLVCSPVPDIAVCEIVILGGLALLWIGKLYSMPFAIFSVFVMVLCAGSREFAHLGVEIGGGILYISEIVLGVVVIMLIPRITHTPRSLIKQVVPVP